MKCYCVGWETDTDTVRSSWAGPLPVLGSAWGWACYLGALLGRLSFTLQNSTAQRMIADCLGSYCLAPGNGPGREKPSSHSLSFPLSPPASCRHCPLGHPRPFWGDLNSKELCQSLSLIISSHCCMALQYLVRRSLPFLFVNVSNGNVCQDQTHILSWLIIFSVFPPEWIYMEGGKWRNR